MNDYKNLLVWQKSIELVVEIYTLTELFPKEETYGLTSQIRRSAISISSNIAEGRLRGSQKEFKHFLYTAFASGGELETQLEIAKRLPKTKTLDYTRVNVLLEETMRMLNVLIGRLETETQASGLKARS